MVNKEQKQKYDKKYYEKNKEKIQAIQKKYRKNNLEKTREYNKKYRETNREKSIEYKKKWYQKNKEKLTEIYDKYRENNREKIKAYKKQYRKENHMKITINKWKSRGLIVDDEDEYDGIYYLVMSTEKCERCECILTESASHTTSTRRCMDHDHFTGQFRAVLCHSCNVKQPQQKQIKL